MKTKTILFLFLLFAGVLVWGGGYYAQAQCDDGECVPEGSCDETYNTTNLSEDCGEGGVCCIANENLIDDDDETPGEDEDTATGEKCSGDFKEIAGVCFPKNTGLAETSISTILSNALFWLLGIFGFFGIAGFVISGIQYLTSAGDEKGIETAKRNMKWSLIGVVVGISGMVIIKAITAALEATTSSF